MRYKLYFAVSLPIATLLMSVSCSKEPDKYAVEAGFSPKGDLPVVTLSTENVDMQEYECKVYVDVTYSGINSSMKKIQLGVMSSVEFDFYQSRYVSVSGSNGTSRVAVPVTPGQTNWIMAVASTQGGASYSEKIAVEVPDVPWYYKIPESYAGDFTTNDGKSYQNHYVYLTFSKDLRTAVLYNFDPFLSSRDGYKVDERKSNFISGVIDLDERVIRFTPANARFFSLNDKDFMFVPVKSSSSAGYAYDTSFEISISEDGQSITIPWYGVYDVDEQIFEHVYTGPVEMRAN